MTAGIGLAVVLAAIAGALWFWKVGQGTANWGPRLAGLLMLTAGTSIAATINPWAQSLARGVGDFAAQLVSGVGVPQLATILTTVGQNAVWIAGVILLVLWVWALLPGGWFSKKRMDWRLALGAAVIPALVLSAPAGPIANLSQLVVGGVSSGVSTLASSFLRLGGAA